MLVCFEQLGQALTAALGGHHGGDNQRRSAGLTGALATITALQLGIDGADGVAGSLTRYYAAARRTLLGNVLTFDPAAIGLLRDDFAEVAAALAAA